MLRPCATALLLALLLAGTADAVITVEPFRTDLASPLRVTAPAGDERVFVVERAGRIRVFDRDGTDRGLFLDWTDETSTGGERGLLGLAFAPDYAASGRFYIHYSDNLGDTRVARLLADPDQPDRAQPGSVQQILFVDQPAANHNGGDLAFGADGMLYIGLGDGGGSGDPDGAGQDPSTLLGKMLRLDVSGFGAGYAVPGDNPFVDAPEVRDEIWALGLRNPWVYSFDRLTGDLYIADVGQNRLEEVNVQSARSRGGENYGWNIMEGSECYEPPSGCDTAGLTFPVYDYFHNGDVFACSISGGFVHRSGTVPDLTGRYLFADLCSNQIWSLDWSDTGGLGTVIEHTAELSPVGGYGTIVGIGEDGLGELYVIDLDGEVWRIASDDTSSAPVPDAPVGMVGAQPNPFNPGTELVFRLDRPATATITLHDAVGRRLTTIVDGRFAAGEHRVPWDGRGEDGRALPSGVYLARLVAGGHLSTAKVTLAR